LCRRCLPLWLRSWLLLLLLLLGLLLWAWPVLLLLPPWLGACCGWGLR
jgi:hypothetical protein